MLTSIDVRATLKAKLGIDVPDYQILGACNPRLAHQALTTNPEIRLPPCNVTVRHAGGRTLVQAVDPVELLAMAGDGHNGPNTELRDVAREASTRLRAALHSLRTAT